MPRLGMGSDKNGGIFFVLGSDKMWVTTFNLADQSSFLWQHFSLYWLYCAPVTGEPGQRAGDRVWHHGDADDNLQSLRWYWSANGSPAPGRTRLSGQCRNRSLQRCGFSTVRPGTDVGVLPPCLSLFSHPCSFFPTKTLNFVRENRKVFELGYWNTIYKKKNHELTFEIP